MGWIILILFIVIVLIVWISLTENTKKYKADFEVSVHETQEGHEAAVVEEVPGRVDTGSAQASNEAEGVKQPPAKAPVADDLTIIEGIGPKVSSLLKKAGITTFAELSKADESQLSGILENAKLKFLDPGTWPQQASLAAEGKMDELHTLQSSLKAGRKTGK